MDLSNDRIVEGSDYVTEISWKNRASKRLYAFEFAIYVNEKYVHQNSAANTNGYVVMGHDYNKIKIRIPKENFEDPITHKLVEKPKIQFIITLDQSEVQTYNRLTT
ncbi:MAG: hypothetical protein MJ233_03805 [Mycoplasmoidaceae bacterium]|nr:hypothetical protein [Mycoplasmoidaceae bacterium]